MNGSDHYRVSEQLLSDASYVDVCGNPVDKNGKPFRPGQHAALIARAQLHAQLAAVAAQVLPTVVQMMGDCTEVTRWANATGARDDIQSPKVEHLPVLGSLCEQDRHDECGFGERCVCRCHQNGGAQ